MLHNQEFLFLHYPKTAGKSLTRYFIEVWDRPIEGLVSKGQQADFKGLDLTNVKLDVARGHENLRITAKLLQDKNLDVKQLRGIFVAIRNPYDLMVSNYFFMRKTYRVNRDRPNFALAATVPFEEYCVRCTMASPERWMSYEDGEVPASLRIIRFEQMSADLKRYSNEFGFPEGHLAHINASEHDAYQAYLTPTAEKAIYKHFQWIFDRGYYSRHEFVPQQVSVG